MKTVLITGGAGFIGSHSVYACLRAGMQVIVLDNLSSGNKAFLPSHARLEFFEGDILNFGLMSRLVKEVDAVLHLAAIASVPESMRDPLKTLQNNTLGFMNLLHAIKENNPNIRLVYASSAAVYGDNSLPCQETMQNLVCSPYALEKANNERYADLYHRVFQINSLGLRYFNVYGARQNPKSPYSGVISKFIYQYQQGKPIIIFGDGQQSRDFIAVEDVVQANLLALDSDYNGVVNIATGVPETLQNLVGYISKIGRHPAQIYFEKNRIGDIKISVADTTQAEKYLGFRHKIALPEGIKLLMTGEEIYARDNA